MKALIQLLGAVFAAAAPLTLGNGPLSVTEWINVGVVAAGAATVWIAANEDEGIWSYTKLFMSAVSAGGVVLVSALADMSISPTEWIQIGAAAIAALAVKQFANSDPGVHRAA